MGIASSRERPAPPARSVHLGHLTDQQLSALAPHPITPGSWWSAGTPPRSARPAPPVAEEAAGLARHVLHTATTIVTFEDDDGRGGLVATEDIVLVDRWRAGRHDVTVVDLPVGVFILSVLLDPLDRARHRLRRGDRPRLVPGSLIEDQVPAVHVRETTVRLVRVTTTPTPTETVLTVVTTAEGATAWRALPSGDAIVTPLDRDGIVGASIALLTGSPTVAAP